MKRIIFASVLLLSFAFSASAGITEKVLKAFNSTFHNAKQVQWHEYETAYQVNFVHNDIVSSVVYDREGNILEARRHSKEDILPLIVREKLQKRFADKQIKGVTEVSTKDRTTYRIVLHDDKKWVIVDSDSYGVLFVRDKFNKG